MKKVERARLLCRDLRHPWVHDATYLVDPDVVERHLSCPRCGTVRIETVVRSTGEVARRRYVYPEGYLQEHGAGRMSAADARVETLKTVRVRMLPASRKSA